jgi:hypothetical protein
VGVDEKGARDMPILTPLGLTGDALPEALQGRGTVDLDWNHELDTV